MPADVKNLHKNCSKPITLWLNTMKDTLPHPEYELFAKAIQKKFAKKTMTEMKPAKNVTSKKTCICAPTNHAGSFRCHLHRNSLVTQNSSWSAEENSTELRRKENFNLNAKNGHHNAVDKLPRPSRFGLATSSRTCHDSFTFTLAEQVN